MVSAIEDPNPEVAGEGHARLRAHGITVEVGLREAEARHAHAGHFRRVRDGRPQVTLKLAVSADGKAGLAGRKPAAITGERARARVHLMRAMNDAILIGIGTALADDPQLTCRLPGAQARSPVRVVLDTALRLPETSALVADRRADAGLGVRRHRCGCARPSSDSSRHGVEVLRVPAAAGRIDLSAMLHVLGRPRHHPADGRGGTDPGRRPPAAQISSTRLRSFAATSRSDSTGIDALEGLPLSAVTASPRFVSRGVETVGEDRLETFERAGS